MKVLVLNHKRVVLILVSILLTYGTQGISYGQICRVGDTLSPGESCTYPGTDAEFSVLNNGNAKWDIPGLPAVLRQIVNKVSVGGRLSFTSTINGVRYNFAASKQINGMWLIEAVGDDGTSPPPPTQEPDDDGTSPPPTQESDLVVDQPSVSQSTLAPGGTFTLSATVRNQGAGRAAGTTLRYYRSTDATISTRDTEVGTDSVSGLGANQRGAESIRLTAPTAPGTYYYGACVEGVSSESLSDNNCSAAVSITVQPSDLVVEQPTVSKNTLVPGESFTLSTTVTNRGSGRAAGTTLRYYRSTDATISTRDTEVGTDSVSALGANQRGAESIRLTAPTAPGTYYYGACVEGVSSESLSDNNCSAAVSITVSNPTLSTSTAAPLTEATLAGSVVTLTLSGGFYELSIFKIRDAIRISGIPGVTVGTFGVDRVNDTEITVELEFNGDFDTDATLTFTVAAGAIADYNGSAFTAQVPVSASTESLVASTAAPLTEATLDESVVTLTLSGRTYERSSSKIRNAVTVSAGIPGVTVGTFDIDRVSDTKITVELTFDGTDFDTNSTITFTVGSGAIADYNGSAFTAQVPVSASTESLVASTASPLTELTLDESVVTLTLSGRAYESSSYTVGRAITVSGIDGVTFRSYDVDRISDTQVTVELTFNGSFQTNSRLTFTVTADAIAGYSGSAFTTHVPVSASSESIVASTASPLTELTLDESVVTLTLSGRTYESSSYTVGRAITVSGIDGVTFRSYDVDRISDTEVTVELTFNGNINTDSTLTFTVGAGAIEGYDGPALTAEISVTPAADVNNNGVVDLQDLMLVASNYGQTGQNTADINGDDVVNIDDLTIVAGALDSAAAAPLAQPQALEMFTAADVKLWLSHARQLDFTDPTTLKGILFLEQLLAALLPKETLLLPNYPNPFNPETWIPYRLANDTDVSLYIYDVDGALVRELDLGHQQAGYYTDRSRAAYWDGRNEWGESVASGVYFYQLRAGDYSQMRKVVIVK